MHSRIVKQVLCIGLLAPALFCIAGCFGDDSNASSPAQPIVTVSPAESPISGTAGVKTDVGHGVTVFALSPLSALVDVAKTSAMQIITDSKKTGGDPSQLVGQTFLAFANLTGVRDIAVITSSETPRAVNECDLAASQCIEIPFKDLLPNTITFNVRAGKFYAIEK